MAIGALVSSCTVAAAVVSSAKCSASVLTRSAVGSSGACRRRGTTGAAGPGGAASERGREPAYVCVEPLLPSNNWCSNIRAIRARALTCPGQGTGTRGTPGLTGTNCLFPSVFVVITFGTGGGGGDAGCLGVGEIHIFRGTGVTPTSKTIVFCIISTDLANTILAVPGFTTSRTTIVIRTVGGGTAGTDEQPCRCNGENDTHF